MKKYTAKALHPEASDRNHAAYVAGCAFFDDGDFHEAKAAFAEALEFWPKDAQAWMALGNCHDELAKPKDAEKCFRRALKYCSDSDRDAICYNLANSLLDQKKFSAAAELYERIGATSSVYAIAQKNLALARNGVTASD